MTTPAGWYPDPERYGHQRYWDGAQWTTAVQPATPSVVRSQSSGKATASMVLGIIALVSVSLVFVLTPIPSIILGILAVIFGKQAMTEIARRPGLAGAGQAKTGLITGTIALALCLVGILLFVVLVLASVD